VATLDRQVQGILERRRDDVVRTDVLSLLLQARAANDRQLRDEVITLYLAGHDATSHALTWVLHFLSLYPAIQQQLRDEATGALNGRTPAYEDLRKLVLTLMAIQESLRMRSPAALIAREAVERDEIGGQPIPAGSWVLISSYLTHRLSEFWPDPETFDPARFSEEYARSRHPFSYYPFGLGPRTCIGNHLATVEVQLILAMMLQRYEFTPAPGAKVGEVWRGTLHPRGGLQLIRRRLRR
jgi:cytochrome P450